MKELAHRIKGAAATLAAEQLRQCAAQLEECGKRAKFDQARETLGEFNTQLHNLGNYLDTYQSSNIES